MSKERVFVSACLLGERCRYDGGDKRADFLVEALRKSGVEAVPFCPEEAGGLGTPRPPCSIECGDGAAVLDGAARVLDDSGRDCTEEFLKGARLALEAAQARDCRHAYLKEHSPSCGTAQTTTSNGRSEGRGVTAELLFRNGIALISVD